MATSILRWSNTCSNCVFVCVGTVVFFSLFVLLVSVRPCVSCRFLLVVGMFFGVPIFGVGICCVLRG